MDMNVREGGLRVRLVAGVLTLAYVALLVALAPTIDSIAGLFFEGSWPSPVYVAFAVVLSLVPLVWLPMEIDRPSEFMHWIIYLIAVLPAVLLPYYTLDGILPPGELLPFSAVVLLGMAILSAPLRFPLLDLRPSPSIDRSTFALLVLGATAVLLTVTLSMVDTNGLFGFAARAAVRDEYIAVKQSKGFVERRLLGYSMSWLRYVFLPLLLSLGLLYRKPEYVLFGLAGFAINYSQAGHRTSVILPVFLIGFAVVVEAARSRRAVLPVIFLLSLLGAGVLGFLFHHVLDIWRPILLFRRVSLSQGVNVGHYYHFFRTNELVLLTDHIYGRPFFDYPYDRGVPQLIGTIYYNRPGNVANANFLGTGFASFGFVGVLAYSTLLSGVLYLYDSFTENLDRGFAIVLLSTQILPITNIGIVTTLVTNGLALLLVVVFFAPELTDA